MIKIEKYLNEKLSLEKALKSGDVYDDIFNDVNNIINVKELFNDHIYKEDFIKFLKENKIEECEIYVNYKYIDEFNCKIKSDVVSIIKISDKRFDAILEDITDNYILKKIKTTDDNKYSVLGCSYIHSVYIYISTPEFRTIIKRK